jgi:hypothetical protein
MAICRENRVLLFVALSGFLNLRRLSGSQSGELNGDNWRMADVTCKRPLLGDRR